MGERRTLNIPRMGDVVLSNTGDGVFTGARASHIALIKCQHKSHFIQSLIKSCTKRE
jgi:hypothetical protein